MVEGLLLPELSLSTECTIDFPSGVMRPRIALLDQHFFRWKRGHEVDMIRHDDENRPSDIVRHRNAVACQQRSGEFRFAQGQAP